MAAPEFEEKEYELQFSIELAAGRLGTVWSAGQVLEGIVGYDGVADPDVGHAVWAILQVPRPRGVVLVPGHWETGRRPTAADLNSNPVSLVLQYKRAEYLHGARAQQWRLWRCPYFRFRRSSEQHGILQRLERELGTDAVVRYAAPAFWRRGDLEANAMSGRVIAESGFVSPMALGTHKVWTYVAPGVDGLGNPSGRRAAFQTAEELAQLLAAAPRQTHLPAVPTVGPVQLASRLTEIATYRRPLLRRNLDAFRDEMLAADLPLSVPGRIAVVGVAAISSLAHQIGASWHLAPRT